MKKRILSMLLLVAMVVTALPLFALTVLATGTKAEEPIFTEDEYNALYVRDGLFFAADFFNTKSGSNLSNYIWKTSGSPSLSATNGTVADGKLSIAAGALTIKPAGNMGATDYDFSVEYVMDAQSFSAADKSIGIRKTYLYGATITAPKNGNGMVFSLKNLRWDDTSNPPTWSYGNGWTQGTWNAFTRHLLSFNDLTVALKAGADTMSFVFAMRDFVDLTVDRAKELEAEVEAGRHAPVFAVYVPGKAAATYASPTAILYRDESCVIGYRISRETFEESKKPNPQPNQYWKWVDENFEPYTDITSAKLEALTAENCTYKLYATQAEAQNAMKNAPATDGTETVKYTYKAVGSGSSWQVERTATSVTDATVTTEVLPTVYATEKAAKDAFAKMVPTDAKANYVYSVGGVYSQLMDKTPAGIDPKLVVGAGSSWSDYIGHTNAKFTGDVYAIRYYSRALTEGETLLNHVADLAKFFGLNIAAYRLLEDEGKLAVAEDMATYQLTSDAAAVGEAFEAACFRELEEQYTSSYDYDSYATFLKYGLDPTPVLALPRDVAKRINALLEQLRADGTYAGDYATLQAAYKAAVAADAEAYAELVDHDEAYYNGFYVKDGLFFAADFYKTNEHWLNVTEETAASLTTESNYAPYVWLTTGTKGILTSDAAGKAFGGKLSLSSTRMVIRHGGSLTATDYNTTVEHVISPRSFTSRTKPFTVRGMAFDAWAQSVVNATETTGLSYPISGLYADKNSDASWGTNGDNPHYRNLGFSRTLLSFGDVPATYTFRPGTSTVSYVMNFEDFVDLTLEEKDALKAAVVSGAHAAPMTIYSVGGDKLSFNIGDAGFYNNIDECTLGYRVMKKVGSKYYWADENFAAMTSLTTAKIDTITSIDNNVAKLYATEAEAKAAIRAYYELGENDALPTDLSVQAFYGKHLDKDPYGVDSNFFYASNTSSYYDYIGYKSKAQFTGDVYAIRYYDRALTEAETLANHAADVLKFYRLNLGGLDATDKALMAELGEATKDIMVGVSTRSEAQAALFSAIADAVDEKYEPYRAFLGEDFSTVRAYHLDPEAYLLLPAGLLFKTNALLAELEAGTFAGASAAVAYTAAIASDCESYYALDVKGTDFYDELYAKDGYVFGLDFFTLGRPDVWGDVVYEHAFKQPDLSKVTFAEDMDATTTKYENNTGLKNALEQFKKDHNSFVEQFITERDVADLNFGHYIAANTSYANAKAVYLPDVGSIRFRKDVSGANGIQPYNFPSIATDNVSFQLVMAPNEGLSNAFFFFYNIRPTIDENYNITGLSTNGFTKTSHKSYAPIPKSNDAQMLTFTLENAVTSQSNVTYSVRLWNELLSETKGSCTNLDNNTYLGWGNSTTMNLYAFRVYNAELTPEEIKQNHFADVAKYFRLNLMGMDVEDAAQMKDLYEAVADISLTASTRAEAQLAVLSVLADEAKAKLSETYADLKVEYPEDGALIDLGAKYLIAADSIAFVIASARDMSAFYTAVTDEALFRTGSTVAAQIFFDEQAALAYDYYSYAKFDPDNQTWTDYLATLADNALEAEAMMALPHADRLAIAEAAPATQDDLDAAASAAMAKYVAYAKEKAEKYTVDDYNALYVRDGLFFAADFYSTNAYWGGEGQTVEAGAKDLFGSYIWTERNGIAASIQAVTAAELADGAFKVNAGEFKVVPGGSMTETDYDFTTEYVFDYKSTNTGKGAFVNVRNHYVNASSVTAATETEGMSLTFLEMPAYSSKSSWGTPGAGAGWMAGDWNGFTRYLVRASEPATITMVKGAQKMSFVFALNDYVDLSLDERNALEAEVTAGERAPAFAVYAAGGETLIVKVPYQIEYCDESCFIGYRILRRAKGEEPRLGYWADENLELYTEVANASDATKAKFAAITSIEDSPYKLYATKEEAEAVVAEKGNAELYAYDVDRFYAIALDETPYGVQPDVFYPSNQWTDTFGQRYDKSVDQKDGFTGDVYAIRYYSRALTEAETLQNHFADLAKYFRLDIANYLAMTADEKAALHAAMADCKVTDDRDAVVAAYYAGCAAQYANLAVTDDADVNEALSAFATAVGLDVSRLVKMTAGEALVAKILALADPAYATSYDVVNYYLDKEVLDFWGVTAFDGISVRVDNGALAADAGVRALYSINEATLREMIRKYGVESKLTFGAKIAVDGVAAATLSFTATLAEDGSLSYVGVNSADDGAVAVKTVDGKLSFSYTVTYTEEQLTEANLAAEYAFVRFVTIAGEDVVIDHGNAVFGETVSAAEAYGYFADAYAEDAVVAKVVAALTPAE